MNINEDDDTFEGEPEHEDFEGFLGYEQDDMSFSDFADPRGISALRAETPSNPRNIPCPTCKVPNRLTPKDQRLGYHCDECANALEGAGY